MEKHRWAVGAPNTGSTFLGLMEPPWRSEVLEEKQAWSRAEGMWLKICAAYGA